MKNKNIVITGTSRGIGFELVKLFAKEGHNVLALSRNANPVTELKLKNVFALPFDLSNLDDYINVEELIKNQWSHVDILINNAGLLLNKPFAETTFQEFQKVYETNVFGVSELSRILMPYMPSNGHVVTISSMGGIQGSMKFPGLVAYSSSKGAVITLSELLAEEFKETGPQFNVLALGAVQTEMLKEAFPDYEAPTTALEMATYIKDFALSGNKYFNGKVLQVSNSTP